MSRNPRTKAGLALFEDGYHDFNDFLAKIAAIEDEAAATQDEAIRLLRYDPTNADPHDMEAEERGYNRAINDLLEALARLSPDQEDGDD